MMRSRIQILIPMLFLAILPLAAGHEEQITYASDGMPAWNVLRTYEEFSGKVVIIEGDVKAFGKAVFVSFQKKPKSEGLELIRRALLKEAKIELVDQKDGRILARPTTKKVKVVEL